MQSAPEDQAPPDDGIYALLNGVYFRVETISGNR
jgi:hypothetical protein